ncbi:DUF5990 family protein [Streptomyces sp. NPDC047028]|uniref:DUF5990 family protein n=1 Tax=Streptomyces sp. NPDC047028 TaxID=3155793 RepID=UPI003405F784
MTNDLRIRIDATDLPGLFCPPAAFADAAAQAYRNIHVAVQRSAPPGELLDPQPGNATAVTWTLPCTATAAPSGIDVKGPYIQGRCGERFIYLSWGTVEDTGTFTMFRRAKLLLGAVPTDVLDAATHTGLLVGRLGLTDATGCPLCARVVPPAIIWTAEPTG